jgi:hypothetical protein
MGEAMTPRFLPADHWWHNRWREVPRPSDAASEPRQRLREAIRRAAGDKLTEREMASVLGAAEEFAAALVELFARPPEEEEA